VPLVALLDTNVWVSAFLKPSGPPGRLVVAWSRNKFSAVTSPSQLTELAEVLIRPRLTRRFKYTHADAATFMFAGIVRPNLFQPWKLTAQFLWIIIIKDLP
jgi:putative PIN family toxin of toxin-antitoxin system